MKENLTCGCCGKIFSGEQTPEHDIGYGTCKSCKSWSAQLFFKARRDVLGKTFKGTQKKKWLSLGEFKQNKFIENTILKGEMI